MPRSGSVYSSWASIVADVEEARLVGILGRDRLDQERRGLVLPHDVRKVVHDVHRRFE